MRSLNAINEFKREAPNAIFTKEQALQITLKLLSKELNDPTNSDNETAVLKRAVEHFTFQHLDATATETDAMLDAFNVARITTSDIVEGIKAVLFEAD
ncbi:MAG: hypothetical protein ACOX64_06640 [Candidatus Merdivicinus sp.]|jgi:hypothetical protein